MLKDLIISITNRCNLRCRMCDIPSLPAEEVETHVWEGVIQDAALLGATTVVFSGGEPLLREDLCDLIAFAKKNKMMACVTSNGILLDESYAYRLLSSGVDVVNISIEGPREVHDHFRGKGSFERALQAVKNLKKFDIECTIASVVSSKNVEYLPQIVRLAREYRVNTIKFQPFSTLFLNAPDRGDEYFLSRDQTVAMEKTVSEVEKLCQEYGIGTNPSEYFKQMLHYLTGEDVDRKGACPALYLSCPINAKGEVYPCWVLSGHAHAIGSVKTDRLIDIWGSPRRAEVINDVKRNGCRGCLMSCYDENFGKQGLDVKISKHLGHLRHVGPKGYVATHFKRWTKRLKFYASWRGSLSSALRRMNGKLVKKTAVASSASKKQELSDVLDEMRRINRLFEKEIKASQ